MSTTFGILTIPVDYDKLVDEDGDLLSYISKDIFNPVFFRSKGNSRWLTIAGPFIPDDTKVFALDNTQQGIFTIKDIKEFLKTKQ